MSTTVARPRVRLRVTVCHENAMLSRLTTVLGLHDVDYFSYEADAGDRAEAVVGVRGDSSQVRRVTTKLHRLIGVLDVVVESPPPS